VTRCFRLGTRRSALALAQAELVAAALRARHPGLQLQLVHISTEGDERRDVPLQRLGGTGAFVKRIERALLDDEIDLAVHSLKDVPTQVERGLVLAAIPERADPRDALVVRAEKAPTAASPACSIEEIARERLPEVPYGARVGTSSQRRAAHLLAVRDDVEIADVRGNVDTRLRKLDEGQYDALVLAAAGLDRLGRAARIARRLDPDELLPMVGQGALAVETRADDAEAVALVSAIDDGTTRACVEAERAFLAALGGGCALPVGALAEVEGGQLRLRVALGDASGRRVERREGRAPLEEGRALASRLAAELLAAVPTPAERESG
jgi:hydroxymethylbilane synthase